MHTFIAKWNGTERKIEMPLESTTFFDLQLRLQNEFQLSSCKITGLKPKVVKKRHDDENNNKILIDCFVLRPMQKILVIGSQIALEDETHRMKKQNEIFEEEVDYDTILAKQQEKVMKKMHRVDTVQFVMLKTLLSSQQLEDVIKSLCHEGDVDTLRKFWKSELSGRVHEFANFAVRNDKYDILVFFRTFSLLMPTDVDTQANLICKAAKYGHLQLVSNLCSEPTYPTLPGKILEKALEGAIENGHLRVARWLYKRCCLPVVISPISVLQACSSGYERVVKFCCDICPSVVTTSHVFATIYQVNSVPEDCINKFLRCTETLLKHISLQWTKDDYDLFLQKAISCANAQLAEILCDLGADINIFEGSLLNSSVHAGNLLTVQFVVQTMHLNNSKFAPSCMSAQEVCLLLTQAVYSESRETGILDYLLTVTPLSDTTLTMLKSKFSRLKNVMFINILQERSNIEKTAQFVATHVATIFNLELVVDINRIILEYFFGSDGRKAARYDKELAFFKQLILTK